MKQTTCLKWRVRLSNPNEWLKWRENIISSSLYSQYSGAPIVHPVACTQNILVNSAFAPSIFLLRFWSLAGYFWLENKFMMMSGILFDTILFVRIKCSKSWFPECSRSSQLLFCQHSSSLGILTAFSQGHPTYASLLRAWYPFYSYFLAALSVTLYDVSLLHAHTYISLKNNL